MILFGFVYLGTASANSGDESFQLLGASVCPMYFDSFPNQDVCQYVAYDFVGQDMIINVLNHDISLVSPGIPFETLFEYWAWNIAVRMFPYLDLMLGQWIDDSLPYTDLGVSVTDNQGRNIFFFGDTNVIDGLKPAVGLPIGYDLNKDYVIDGVLMNSERYYSVSSAFLGEVDLFNTHELAYMDEDLEVGFFVPTGAVHYNKSNGDEVIYYWYGKYIQNPLADQSHLLKWNLETNTWSYIGPFAEKKFIQVNAIPVSASEFDLTLYGDDLPFSSEDEEGFFLYGSGNDVNNLYSFEQCVPGYDVDHQTDCWIVNDEGTYRNSQAFLAYISADEIESSNVQDKLLYWNNYWGWRPNIELASSIDRNTNSKVGEFSAKRIPETDYILIVYPYQGAVLKEMSKIFGIENVYLNRLNVHLAKIDSPWEWSSPITTYSMGYGNYVVEPSIQYYPYYPSEDDPEYENVLFFNRIVSTWKGDSNLFQYGTTVNGTMALIGDLIEELESGGKQTQVDSQEETDDENWFVGDFAANNSGDDDDDDDGCGL